MELSIDDIRTDGGTQPRAQIDMIVVAEYAEAMRDGATFPPVTVFFDGSEYWLADGFHRVKGAKQAGLETIAADVRQGTRRDAVLHSVGANANHGLRRTNEDKRRAVLTLLNDDEWVKESDGWIARHAAVTQPFVSKIRRELTQNGFESPSTRRGADGRTINTANIGRVHHAHTPTRNPTANIAPDVIPMILHTPAVDDRREIEKLARLEETRQREVAEMVATGRADTVTEALQIQARERVPEPAVTPLLPQGKYRCIVIDPPWPMKKIERDERPYQGIELDYPTMTLEEIEALPVGDFALEDGCHLYLWVTQKYLPVGLRLMEAWGFRYQCVMTWVKPTGITPYSWMYNTEHVLFGRIGNLPLERLGLKLSFEAPVIGHSVKPDAFYERVVQASPGPRLEMFARRAREGFKVWGNEV